MRSSPSTKAAAASMRKGKYLDERGAGEREGLPGLHARGDERGRPQLAAGQGQRDLPPRRSARAPQRVRVPGELNEVTRTYFERSAAVESDPKVAADMRAVAKPDTDMAAAARLSALCRTTTRMMRTTCVATTARGGHAPNALPQLATANVNCRILPGDAAGRGARHADPSARQTRRSPSPSSPSAAPSPPSPLRPDVMGAVESFTERDVSRRRRRAR